MRLADHGPGPMPADYMGLAYNGLGLMCWLVVSLFGPLFFEDHDTLALHRSCKSSVGLGA